MKNFVPKDINLITFRSVLEEKIIISCLTKKKENVQLLVADE
jgi:hypothetical protein